MGFVKKARAGGTKIVRVGQGAVKKAKEAAGAARARLSQVNAKVKAKSTGLKYAGASLAGAAITGAARGMSGGEIMGFDVAHIAAAALGVGGAMMNGEAGNLLITAAAGAEGPVVADFVEDLFDGGN